MAALGQTFPEWVRPRGSAGCILQAGELLPTVAKPEHIQTALGALLALPPLCYLRLELAEIRISGHSMHTPPDWTVDEWTAMDRVRPASSVIL